MPYLVGGCPENTQSGAFLHPIEGRGEGRVITEAEGAVQVGLYTPLRSPILPRLQVFKCLAMSIKLWYIL